MTKYTKQIHCGMVWFYLSYLYGYLYGYILIGNRSTVR